MFVQTLTADDKYSLLNRDYSMQLIRTKLSQKLKLVLDFFFSFSKCTLNFQHFQNKDDPRSLFISEVTHSEKRG